MEQMQMNMPDIYDAALYLRLSKDDMEEGSPTMKRSRYGAVWPDTHSVPNEAAWSDGR